MLSFKSLVLFKLVIIIFFSVFKTAIANNDKITALAESYANLVHHYYNEVALKTISLDKAIILFLENPNEATLKVAKKIGSLQERFMELQKHSVFMVGQ